MAGCAAGPTQIETPRHSVGPLPNGTYTSCVDATTRPHDDPELEALLPATVAGRRLSSWSVSGWCLVEVEYPGNRFARAASGISDAGIDVDELRMAITGRTDVEDPPYFVWAVHKPSSQDAQAVAFILLSGAMGALDPGQFATDPSWEGATIGGKQVGVGSAQLIDQTEHQRGKPYIYETDTELFALIADDEDWAAEALRQLP